MNQDLIIPEHIGGKKNDITCSVTFPAGNEARGSFVRACKRLLNPQLWHELCGMLSAEFILTDEKANKQDRFAAVNDLIRIDIPGPGPATGDGYDWVRIVQIVIRPDPAGEEEYLGMKVQPTASPLSGLVETAHFFTGMASSTFLVKRKGNVVTCSYHGRNEQANTDTNNTTDNIRNAMVAAGAFGGLSDAQWYVLTKAFLQEENAR